MSEQRKRTPKKPPGILIGYELLDAIRLLPDKDVGKLMRVVLEYGANNREPSFNSAEITLRIIPTQ